VTRAAFVALLLGLLMAQIWLTGVSRSPRSPVPLPGFDIPGAALIVVTGGCIVTLASFDRLGCTFLSPLH